ncbi:CaiB/BaiF CoA-transferase family protein [Vulcanisaeta distributa]|uniref:CaiB/BaiF CoA transferase family protein n=1 Tax=Vulcanisaeta distributa TaxID=164451 RepID=UPI0006D0FA09|nr:CaiB/BaiF CoA-transferase family protein [Vulcanisaeta distributa]
MFRVLDLTRLYPGGVATRILADLGFDVIKVEDTESGDYLREISPMLFEWLNAGKRSIAINLKTGEGRELFYRLVRNSHVVIEGFRPGVTKRLGIDYETLKNVNERIVYCSINGYGENGPYSGLPNHDINTVGIAGLLDPDLFSDGVSRPLTVQVADVGSALLCVIGVLSLLLRGVGGRVEVSMMEAALLFNTLNMAMTYEGTEPTLTGKYPFYNVYRCRDGYITIGAIETKFWQGLCRALNREDLINRQFDKGAIDELSREFSKYTVTEALRLLWSHDVPAAPVNSIKNLGKDPQLIARGGFNEREFLNPLRINGAKLRGQGKAPKLGENTVEILMEIGLSHDEISKLAELGVIVK